jgi:hypothetical protein
METNEGRPVQVQVMEFDPYWNIFSRGRSHFDGQSLKCMHGGGNVTFEIFMFREWLFGAIAFQSLNEKMAGNWNTFQRSN